MLSKDVETEAEKNYLLKFKSEKSEMLNVKKRKSSQKKQAL